MNGQEEVTILLVDDDESHAELARINLERSGLTNEIVHFIDAHQALDFLFKNVAGPQENKYLVILDINMPGLDGHKALQRIKSSEQTKNIPVIMLTTAEDEGEVARCYALGCNIYLTKPMAYEDFSDAIHSLGLFIQRARVPGVAKLVVPEGA